jgi:hypothetical protein
MKYPQRITSRVLNLGLCLTILTLSACHSGSNTVTEQGRGSPPATGTSGVNTSPASKPLQLVLEGPFAVCTAPSQYPGKFQILIPTVGDHFEPGFDTDVGETLLCKGEYSLNLGNRKAGRGEFLKRQSAGRDVVFDTVAAECPPKSHKYLTLLVDKPDQIEPLTPTTATVTGTNASPDEQEYVSRVMLYYEGVDPTKVQVEKISAGKCLIPIKALDIAVQEKEFPFPWSASFNKLSSDLRLQLAMTPTLRDNYLHTHAKSSYKAVAKMLGAERSVEFPNALRIEYGPHNDCRAPQVLVEPLENAQ